MTKLEVPDQGWAWVVAFAACIINMLLSGISRMIGILYVYVLQMYGITRQEATLPFAVRNSVRMLSGPLVGIVGQSFGIRTITFSGGVVATVGVALCCIAPDITWITVFWGGMHGIGFAFANTLFQVVVNEYFEKHRATASGIALSGACIGSLAFPIMIEAILDTYGLSGGFLMIAGVVMHVLPPALLLKSPPWVQNPEKYAKQLAATKTQQSATSMESVYTTDSVVVIDGKGKERGSHPISDINNQENNSYGSSKLTFTQKGQPGKGSEVICNWYSIKESPTLKKAHQMDLAVNTSSEKVHTISEKVEDAAPSKLKSIKQEDNQQSLMNGVRSFAKLYTNPLYILISVCLTTYIILIIPVFTVIVDYSIDKGIPEKQGKYLINGLAIGELVGRLGFGWVTDRGIMTIPAFMTLTLVLQGVFTIFFPLTTSLYTFMAVLMMFGMASGSMLVLFPVLVLKYVDINSQAVAMACDGFIAGLLSFCFPLLIGHFRDTVGSYDGMFFLNGGIAILTGGLWLLEPFLVKTYFKENTQEILHKNYFKNVEVKKDDEKLR
ncbi:monocarboxylate transporter 12 [Parasteatoda tepidariorum]|uniref:monocarboxylate transporter 12 n=1 Tax=Parasteatoda tepidariorum TaxID=114398 RepID=UPI001C723F0B|nr:monocarboxylate transporter 5-like [Parasteatoda tepidariorum]